MEASRYYHIFKLFFLISLYWTECHSNGNWVVAPTSTMTSFTGEDLTLEYEYNKDPSYDTPVRFTIGHYVPGRTYEDLLFEGNLDPVTGHIEVKHNYEPSKINVTSYLEGFSIRVDNLSVSDSGQYLVDFRFTVYDYRHRGVMLTVYNRPCFVKTPSSDDVIAQKGSTSTMQWALTDVSSQPAIDNLQIKHHTARVSHTLVHQQSLTKDQWGITYPDEQLRFKGRLSYAPGRNLERVELYLWELEVEDSGLYTIEIIYIDGVIILTDSVQLHVASGIEWVSIPRSTTYIIESSAHTFNFTAGNSTVINPIYELSKLTNEEKRETLVSLLITGDTTSYKFELSWNSGWRLQYNRSTHSMLVQVPNVLATDAGNYTIAMKSETDNILAYHQFSVIVINETTLNPKINTTSNGHAITLEIRVDDLVLKPYIIVYGGNTEEPHVSARTNTLNTSMSRPQEHVVVLVKYDSEDIQYIKRHLVDIADDGSDHVTHSEGLTNRSTYQTARTCVIPDEVVPYVYYRVIILLEVVAISTSLALAVMYLYYTKNWIHPHIKRAKSDEDPAGSFPKQLGTSGYNTNKHMGTSGYNTNEPFRCGSVAITADRRHLQEYQDTPSESSRFLMSPDNDDPFNGYSAYLSASPKVPNF